jgi:glycosyltransferase involved in cell wall biosynthesis
VLDHGRGLLVPFESPAAIAKATIKLLDDDKARQAMRERAYLYARPMVWKRVAQSYMATILRARVRPAEPVQIGFAIQTNTREADQRAVSA